jgi:ATP-dependent exoDNAse (exonuclease V) beta subunit
MSVILEIPDHDVRLNALNPTQSFIVQAPAGSGKTELLVQRALRILAEAVKEPEEMLAITFTRKAAGEMRARLLHALTRARDQIPFEAHQAITEKLAKRVLTTDQERQWHLLENPSRLRIITIDALSGMLCAQMPLPSGFGAKPQLLDDPSQLYRSSITQTLNYPSSLKAVTVLLKHLNNDAEKCANLLFDLLAKRGQWLPYIIPFYRDPNLLKQYLEKNLRVLIEERLAQLNTQINKGLKKIDFPDGKKTLIELIDFAANTLNQTDPSHPLTHFAKKPLDGELPPTNADALSDWQTIAGLLLTKELSWRKQIDKRLGFPPEAKAMKAALTHFIELFDQDPEALNAWQQVALAPRHEYADNQWQVLEALIELLPQLVANLNCQFQQEGVIDFIELNLGALRALGSEEEPSDLALYLDYQIHHLLIDEFQDTSVIQYQLLTRLVQAWETHEGRSVFLVGDPMQSIYRFRDAEVSLFLNVQSHGFGHWPLEAVKLTRNFRSTKSLVEWNNALFSKLLPKLAKPTEGAVSHSPCHSDDSNTESDQQHLAINYQLNTSGNDYDEARYLAEKINDCLAENSHDTVAILVRSRQHLKSLLPLLDEFELNYEGIDLDPLITRPEIRDLMILTEAMLQPANRLAWLSIFRAPFIGLNLADLLRLSQTHSNLPLLLALENPRYWQQLSQDAQLRLAHAQVAIASAYQEQGRLSLSAWIKTLWHDLGGHMGLSASALKNTTHFFDFIDSLADNFSLETLQQGIHRLYAQTPQSSRLKIMTIHKAKGLEFDHVFLPALNKAPKPPKTELLRWQEITDQRGNSRLLISPMQASDVHEDSLFNWIKRAEQQKFEHEFTRLFYVATTRAKKTLTLSATLKDSTEPTPGSFLNLIWRQESENFLANLSNSTAIHHSIEKPCSGFARLSAKHIKNTTPIEIPTPYFKLQARLVDLKNKHNKQAFGKILHAILELVFHEPNIGQERLRRFIKLRLQEAQLNTEQYLECLELAILNTRQDPRGQWLLASTRGFAEYRIHSVDSHDQILDRYFIDENGRAWIVDYKSATPNTAEALEEQKDLHRPQLEGYAAAIRSWHQGEIHLGLYFPLCQQWISWTYQSVLETVQDHS